MPEPVEPSPDENPTPKAADWLVGAEEGLAAEMERSRPDSAAMIRPPLLRPGALPGSGPSGVFERGVAPEPEAGARPGTPLPAPGPTPSAIRKRFGAVTPDLAAASDFVNGSSMTWEPAPSSVPTSRRTARAAPAPTPTRDFPTDNAEERPRERTAVFEEAMADALAASRSHEVVSPDVFNVDVVPMPWWIQFAHVVGTDRRLQAMIVAVLVVFGAIVLWPRGPQPTSVGRIRNHAERYDGADVKVSGRVGQVFSVGGGYAFYLVNGADTLVVFTRTRVPVERQRVSVSGTMSNGSLDGQPTLALFESVKPAR